MKSDDYFKIDNKELIIEPEGFKKLLIIINPI